MDRYPKLNVSYDNKKIVNNFTVIEGGFINTGSDINSKDADIKFNLILPEKCQIIAVNIKTSNDKLKVIPSIDNSDNNILHYEIEKLFLQNDSFIYSIIVESGEAIENIGEKLFFEHRMYKTKKITELKSIIFKGIPSKKEEIICIIVSLLLALYTAYLSTIRYKDIDHPYELSTLFSLLFVCLSSLGVFCVSVHEYCQLKKIWGVLKNK